MQVRVRAKERLPYLFTGRERSHRHHATAKRLGHRYDVRLNAVMLGSEHCAGAAECGADLIKNEQAARLVADIANARQVVVSSKYDPTLALDRLQHHGAGAVGNGRFQRRQVMQVEPVEVDVAQQQDPEVAVRGLRDALAAEA